MDQFDMMWEPVRAFLMQVGEFFPRVILALVILLVGWLIAKAVRFAVVKALRAINFNVLTERAGIDTFLKQGGGEIAVTELVVRVVLFVPKVIVAIVILAFGAYFARFIGMSVTAYCKNLDMPDAALFGRLAMYAIVVFVAMVAIDHLGLGDIIRQTFLILLTAVALALALAFGLGGQKRAADFLERWSRRAKTDEPRLPDRPPAPGLW